MIYETTLDCINRLEFFSQHNDQPDDKYRNCFLKGNRAEVRNLGKRLNEIGGYSEMLLAFNAIEVKYRYDKRELEEAWKGIGYWGASQPGGGMLIKS